jgi:penicillin-binding protein 2
MLLLGSGKLALLGALIGRLYYLQVIDGAKYRALSDENRIDVRILPPRRGLILDRRGRPIAENAATYRVELVAEQAVDVEHVLKHLQRLTSLTERQIAKALAKQRQRRSFTPITIVEDIPWEDVAKIELNLPDLAGLTVREDQKRSYPYGGIASHIIGYVASPSEQEAGDNPLLNLPGFHIGKAGLERQYETALRGTPGTSQEEVNASGRIVRELAREASRTGSDLRTTIDIKLQTFAYQRLASEFSGAVVVLDVETGGILAMASVPGYDPAAFYHGITSPNWRELTEDIYRPLTNKAIAGQYAPGSTFKPVTALAILEAGIDPTEKVFCPGFYRLGNARFHCWKTGGHGPVDITSAIQHSCDVYFYEMARRVGIDPIAAVAQKFGFGRPTGLDLVGERPGLIPSSAWKRATMSEAWQQGETLVAAIGQGFVLATPLQLALMAAQLANGGRAIKPHFALPKVVAGAEQLSIDARWLAIVTEGMRRVTNDLRETAYGARISIPGMEMAGKTGTSQVRRISMEERGRGVSKNEDLPWNRHDHALFIAYAPISNPKFSCAVVVEHGGGGSAVAAPIARDILIECQQEASRRL